MTTTPETILPTDDLLTAQCKESVVIVRRILLNKYGIGCSTEKGMAKRKNGKQVKAIILKPVVTLNEEQEQLVLGFEFHKLNGAYFQVIK